MSVCRTTSELFPRVAVVELLPQQGSLVSLVRHLGAEAMSRKNSRLAHPECTQALV